MANGDFTRVVSLNGTLTNGTSKDFTPTNTTLAGNTACYDQIITVPSGSIATVFQIGAADGGATFTAYSELWLQNMDSSIAINVKVAKENVSAYAFTLAAGKVIAIPNLMLGDASGLINAIGTPVAFTHILAQAASSTAKLRIFALKA